MLCLSMPTPGFPHYYYILGANLGSLLHSGVFVMGWSAPMLSAYGINRFYREPETKTFVD